MHEMWTSAIDGHVAWASVSKFVLFTDKKSLSIGTEIGDLK